MIDERKFTTALGRHIVNPLVSLVAGYVPWWALLETRGRRSGQPRRNPVGNGLRGQPVSWKDVATAAVVAAGISGLPSTVHAVVTGRSPLEATEAAGSILLPAETRRGRLIAAAALIHLALSGFWASVLALLLPRRLPKLSGAIGGIAIAVVDLMVIGRRWARIRALPLGSQFADHVAFGIVVATVLSRSRSRPPYEPKPGRKVRLRYRCQRGTEVASLHAD